MIEITQDPNTLLLLHGEDLTDGSMYGHAVTNSGVSVSTAQSKFGGKSLYFNGSSKMQISASPLFDFGTGDWTFDAWVYPLTNAKDNLFVCGTVNNALFIGRTSDNAKMGIGRASVAWDVQTTSTITKDTWNHFACVKASGKVYIFVNGNLAYSVNNTQSYGMVNGAFDIGCMNNDFYYKGYMDEVRFSNVARWTSNFTPPTAPYKGGGIEITAGGVIPKKWALRRRILATEIKAAQQNPTIQLFGEFYQNSYTYAEMVVDGIKYNTAQTIAVPKGTIVTLRIQVNAWYDNLEYDSQIIVNGTVVVRATTSGQLLSYNYTVNEDCTIESYVHYSAWGSNSYAFRVTT